MRRVCIQSTDPIGGKNFSQNCQNAPYRVGHPIGGTFSKKKLFFFKLMRKHAFIMCVYENAFFSTCAAQNLSKQLELKVAFLINKKSINVFLINKKWVNGFLHVVKKYRMRKFDPFRFEIRPMFGNIAGHEDSEIALFKIGVFYSDFQ